MQTKGSVNKKSIWTKKDLLGLEYLSHEEINLILYTAASFKEVTTRKIKKVPALRGKTIVNLFYEPSTRTRTSFELAAKRLSADVINIAIESSSVKKGETLIDTGRNIEALKIDIIVVRHSSSGAPNILANSVNSSVVNAGDGWHEHPTQALLDMFTLKEKLGKIEGLKVSIIGDIRHSRVARSNIWGLTKLGAEVVLCGPATMIPPKIDAMGARVVPDLREAISGVDVVYTLRIQLERQTSCLFPSLREYIRLFRVDNQTLEAAPDDALIMHPGPINRDIELAAEVADGPRSVVLEQVTNGVAIRMAIMHLLANSPAAA